MSNFDIENYIKKLKIKHFRGVFMKDELPKKPRDIECGIINLENHDQLGSHWVAYYKQGKISNYFDSYGNAPPPLELQTYLKNSDIYYNKERFQDYDDLPICGYLCLHFLFVINGKIY